MPTGTYLTTYDRTRIHTLFARGQDERRIARDMGIGLSTVREVLAGDRPGRPKTWQPVGELNPRKVPAYTCPGCHRKISIVPCVACFATGGKR